MAIIKDSGHRGVVESLCIHVKGSEDIASVSRDSVQVSFAGFEGDSHCGVTRASCVRVKRQYKTGTTIRNTRQVSIVSLEELTVLASALGVDVVQPQWLGANLCLSGIPEFTRIPPATRLLFSSGAALVVDVENEPCKYPAEVIERNYPGKGKAFVKSAQGIRGVTAWVEREGRIRAGEAVEVHTPTRREWGG